MKGEKHENFQKPVYFFDDSLNNSPEDLQIMTFQEHTALHGTQDNAGQNNPMFGRQHSNETKDKIGSKTIERCKDPLYREKLSKAQTKESRDKTSKRMKKLVAKQLKQYYLQQEEDTDLDTLWIQDRLYAKRNCEICGKEILRDLQCFTQHHASGGSDDGNGNHHGSIGAFHGYFHINSGKYKGFH